MKYCEYNKWRNRSFEKLVNKYGKELGIEITKTADENFKDKIMSTKKGEAK
jgi:hypothetical protein